MAKQRSRPTRRRDKKGGPVRPPQVLPVLPGQGRQVDYKDVGTLRKFVSDRGKIRSRRITGACRRHQNQIATAVKRARELALLPYVGDNREERDERGGRGATTAIATATGSRHAAGHPAAGRREPRHARHRRRRLARATCATT